MTFRYVPFDRIADYLLLGWHFCGIASHHSALMHSCACHDKEPVA